ncbi:TonB-dependent receptor plug domain-containing protein [Rhodohalobacter mucosus]|uniref:TonB-dependent receptor plug domain-containing protein n=1 Tax=Rhodohalobacter mucosus TaxID=2079485 RepID=A0A316TVH0_9BACT|nr:TonB-dependent receptor plug domain-containing protein [Rhodohalobacter mucosus]PWN07309.1 hypothetical protein DDZ15_03305 [Rhodohalobacter mucosus]
MKSASNLLIPLFILLSACATTERTTDSGDSSQTETSESSSVDPSISLLKQIRMLPGIYVESRGGELNVYLRGQYSFNAETRVLFVVNNVPIGRDFNALDSMVNVEDIQSIRVMRAIESAQLYGLRGSSGAIVIKTK